MGGLEYSGHNFQVAADHFAECEKVFRAQGDRFGLAWTRHMAGLNLMEIGELDSALAAYREAITLFADSRDVSGVVLSLDDFAQIAELAGNLERAIRLSGAATALEKQSGTELASNVNRLGRAGRPSDNLTGEDQARAFAEGQRMILEEAVAYALESEKQ